ncbi:phosphomannomutase [Thalassotalea agariperforans]
METLTCFKSYDVRGKVPEQLNPEIAYKIGRAYVEHFKPKAVAIGHDIRLTSPQISKALCKGILESGSDVVDIGLCGTEEVYFAAATENVDGGICVTASHNPKNYNGMKFVTKGAKPVSSDNGLLQIRTLAEKGEFEECPLAGSYTQKNIDSSYLRHLLSYIDTNNLKPLKLVVNAGNGGAGKIIDLLEKHLPFDFIKINHQPDGSFPHGVPNPLLEENRFVTQQAVIEHKADLGIAWDGDFDRCFFFDEKGNFVEGYYLVGLFAKSLLEKSPGSAIIYDPRLYWNTLDVVEKAGGKAVMSKTGHAFIKNVMRQENAVYGGEMSAHHYFQSFSYCDNGTIPWLLLTNIISTTGLSLSNLINDRIQKFPCSGEINIKVELTATFFDDLANAFNEKVLHQDRLDGLTLEFKNWRFNVRASSTEPLLRINVESREDSSLVTEKSNELLQHIKKLCN